MVLRRTLLIVPNGETKVIKVEIFVSPLAPPPGVWNTDNNKVILTPGAYSEFDSCKRQNEQKKFFSRLRKISNSELPVGIV